MSEANCKYVCSRGLLKSCDYYSRTIQSSARYAIDYPNLDEIRNKKNPSIYVCNTVLPDFINKILNNIDFPFVLVSGDSDVRVPKKILSDNDFNKFLENPFLIHWYCQNMEVEHEKITNLPIGLDYHTQTTLALWGPRESVEDQEKNLISIVESSKPFYEREIKCYCNCLYCCHDGINDDRVQMRNRVPAELMINERFPMPPRTESWNNQINYSFVLCPAGNGRDTHRFWEALILGCIPIVTESPMDKLFEGLPVLILKSYKDITQDLLNETVEKFKKMEFNYEKLLLKYWTDKINSH